MSAKKDDNVKEINKSISHLISSLENLHDMLVQYDKS